MSALLRVLLSAGLLIALAGASAAVQDKAEKKDDKVELPLGESAWDIKVFSQEPIKVVRTSYDSKAREVKWVIEWTRDLKELEDNHIYERAGWAEGRAPFKFRFMDEDGVVLKVIRGSHEGEFARKKGDRIRIFVQLPEDAVFSKIKKIVTVCE
jgi:hypothetical protein